MATKKKSVTLRDVARYAGVSIKTVSNVINDWPYVRDETREKVQDAIRIVGYRPNQMARSLVTGQTKSRYHQSDSGCDQSVFQSPAQRM